MEHRLDRRIAMHTPVLVYRRGERVAVTRMRDFCAEGVFLETRVSGFRLNDYVELAMPLLGLGARVPALVAHVARDGMGLMLDPDSAQVRRFLRCIATSAPQAQRVVA
ncbi:MAG TPA: PilZ domain-containing protein [Gammaproteobacteria bacterium]|nr:PilZ domain-containing protein [Gammaproteobacteria bacterium]